MPSTVTAGRGFLGSRFIAGAALTVAFYTIVELPGINGSVLHRYTTGHPVEYLSIALFFIAVADLGLKALRLGKEKRALSHDWLPATHGPQPIAAAADFQSEVDAAPRRWRSTYIARRLQDALHDVNHKQAADQLDEHLRYLADQEADQCHASYGSVRVIAWMIPILGFLGTVIGITLAIANITPSQLETSLHEVTGGLAVAFDTTALALSLSIALMFLMTMVESAEQRVLHGVEKRVHRELAYRFRASDPTVAPYLAHLQATGESIIDYTRKLVEQQSQLWANTVSSMHGHVHESNKALEDRLNQTLSQWQNHFHHQGRALAEAADSMAQVQADISRVAELLSQVVDGEGQLVQSQERLSHNLSVLQQSQSFDEALNSLTAAIHLMTIRNQPTLSQKNVA